MPALPAITAKILVLVEKVLDCFVTVEMSDPTVCCSIANFSGTTTVCGDSLVSALSGGLMALVNLGVYFLGALGVNVT